jgi:hypothetical protein
MSEPKPRTLVEQARNHVAAERVRKSLDYRIAQHRAEQGAAPLVSRDAVVTLVKETVTLKKLTLVLIGLTVAVLVVSIITLART